MIRSMAGIQRHYHERWLGGVCGGLATHFFRPAESRNGGRILGSAAFWRACFLVWTPLTLGGALWVYLALWFWLPGEAPVPTLPRAPRREMLRALWICLTLLVVLASVSLWRVGRPSWPDAVLALVWCGGALVCVTDLRPRGTYILPLLLLSLLLVGWAWRQDAFSPGMADWLARIAPAPLLFWSLRALLRGERAGERRALLANGMALVGTGALCAFFTMQAFARFDARLPQDASGEQFFQRALPSDLRLLRIELLATASDVIIERSLSAASQIDGRYLGSANQRLELSCNGGPCADEGRLVARDDGTADFHIHERARAAFPPLAERGRGALRLQLPGDVPLDLLVRSRAGELTLSLAGIQLERLNVELAWGDALVSLPLYAPLGAAKGDAHGTLQLERGSLTLRVPRTLDGRFTFDPAVEVAFPQDLYAREGDALVTINPAEAAAWSHYRLAIGSGSVRLIVTEP